MDIILPQNDLKQPILYKVDLTQSQLAFHPYRYSSASEAFRYGLNEQFWRWGLVFSQGNELNVSENRVKERLRFIASGLLRRIYGNRYRNKAKIRFLVFKHGSSESFNQHYHVLMALEGETHGWSDFRIEMTLRNIDSEFIEETKSEKLVFVDRDWAMEIGITLM